MNNYRIIWKKSAAKELKSVPDLYQKKIISSIENLLVDIHPHNSTKLISIKDCFRMRIADYRVIYRIENDTLIIEIIRIAHRKEAY